MPPSLKDTDQFARQPKQSRSRQSLERLLSAAAELLVEKGYSEFTLQEVSSRSKVSIGSIYNRFNGKDDLIRQVQQREVHGMDVESAVIITNLRRQKLPIRQLVPAIVEAYAEFLRRYKGLLRAFMEAAIGDEVVAQTGRKHFTDNIGDFEALLLECRSEIQQPDAERAVGIAFRLVYSSLARYLGLGTMDEHLADGDWETLLEELSCVALHYLLGKPEDIS